MYLKDVLAPSQAGFPAPGAASGEYASDTSLLPSATAPSVALRGLANEELSKCEQIGGTCIDTKTQSCSSAVKTGYCPGASNIRCCVGTIRNASGGKLPTGPPTLPPAMPGSPASAPPSGVDTASFTNGALWVLGGIAVSKLLKMW
jgi:hypothetical protein